MNGIKSVHVNSLACVRVKGCESESFRIDSGVRQVCIMSPWLFNVYMNTVMKGVENWDRSGDFLASCMQMTWLCVVSWRKT